MATVSVRMAAASSDDIKLAWAVYRAAQRLQYENWNYSARDIDFENLSRAEKLFFLRCYKFAVEEGAFNRIFGGYDTLFSNVCDPTSNVLDFKPSLAQQLQDGELLPVLLEAYEEARSLAPAMDSEPVAVTDDELNAALQLHRLKVDGHSQLSDAFRAGFRFARRTTPQPAPSDILATFTRERLLEIIVTGPAASGAEQNALARIALSLMPATKEASHG